MIYIKKLLKKKKKKNGKKLKIKKFLSRGHLKTVRVREGMKLGQLLLAEANRASLWESHWAESYLLLIKLYTLFKDPFADIAHTAMIMEQLWEDAQNNTRLKIDKDEKIEGYLRSIQSRTRSHLLHEIKRRYRHPIWLREQPSTYYAVMYGSSWMPTDSPAQKKSVRTAYTGLALLRS
ncbi:hypothetical protein BDZ91DRAFT_24534 [Kalaharituber pfeilii]|nr:hypothetical protein BDZ91DRAFT_24534 [Kalaharituber pfeilii]